MTEYKYATYNIGNFVVLDEGKPGDVELDPVTPAMQRAIRDKIMRALDESMSQVLSGGAHVETNCASPKGVTIQHVRRPRSLLPDSG